MKSKQLANVLIKIIGLYVCVCAIPGVISGIVALFIPDVGFLDLMKRFFVLFLGEYPTTTFTSENPAAFNVVWAFALSGS